MKRQRGFSLVELMIAVALGLLLTGVAITAFLSVKKGSTTQQGMSTLADSGRFALEQIGGMARVAGFLGCSTSVDARVDLNAALSLLVRDLGEPLGGYEYTGTSPGQAYALVTPYVRAGSQANWTSTAALGGQLDAVIYNATATGGVVGNPIPGSDALVIHASPTNVPVLYVTAPAAVGTSTIQTNVATVAGNGFSALIAAGRPAIGSITNCRSSEVFSVSAIAAPNVSISAANAQNSLVTGFGAGSKLALVDTRIYYIGVGSDGEPSLFMIDSQGSTTFSAPVELATDVENMQILYGVDTNGNRATTRYVRADQVAGLTSTADFNGVISIKVALLVSAAQASGVQPAVAPTFNLLGTTITAPRDTRARAVFTETFTLRNGAG